MNAEKIRTQGVRFPPCAGDSSGVTLGSGSGHLGKKASAAPWLAQLPASGFPSRAPFQGNPKGNISWQGPAYWGRGASGSLVPAKVRYGGTEGAADAEVRGLP
jgi:hypothetical protein